MTTRYRTTAAAIVATLALAIPLAASAGGHTDPPPPPDDVTVLGTRGAGILFEGPLGRIYPQVGTGFVLTAPIELVCTQPPPVVPGITFEEPDGQWTLRSLPGGVPGPLELYEVDPGVGVFEFLDATCPGGPPYPEPLAVGTGTLRERARNVEDPYWSILGPQPPGHYLNVTSGVLEGAGGDRFRVKAVADYAVTDDGSLETRRDVLHVVALG